MLLENKTAIVNGAGGGIGGGLARPFAQINEGRFYVATVGNDWVIQRLVLREQGGGGGRAGAADAHRRRAAGRPAAGGARGLA